MYVGAYNSVQKWIFSEPKIIHIKEQILGFELIDDGEFIIEVNKFVLRIVHL